MNLIHSILKSSPEIALFLSLALGYWIGKFKFGSFQLGGVAGSLLAAVLISQLGVHIDSGIKPLLFALFIYAVGFESGPQFFRSLGRQTLREVLLSVVVAAAGLATVVILARMFHLDKGLAAGLASGGLTQSAIIGTAGSAIEQLGLSPAETRTLQANVAIAYAVSYIFGSFGAIILCVNVLEWMTGRRIRDDAQQAQQAQQQGAKGVHVTAPGDVDALPPIIGRVVRVTKPGLTVQELESRAQGGVTVENVKRGSEQIGVHPDLALQANDRILLVGRREALVGQIGTFGEEDRNADDMDLAMAQRDVAINNPAYLNRSVADISHSVSNEVRHGIYVLSLRRAGSPIAIKPDTIVRPGDTVTLLGSNDDLQRAAKNIGQVITPSDKTDLVYHGIGISVGLLIGLLVVHLGAIPITLGAGGGALLSGLVFGWWRTRQHTMGNLPTGASQFMRDFGLAGFVAMVGLQSGQQAVTTIKQQGLKLFLLGAVVTIVPFIIGILFGKYVLKYKNAAIFAGALSGARSSNPAFGQVLDQAGNSVPTTPFAITYALANVFLTLLGPLVVAFA